tara:strand:- start:348 stop:749 length:402 start_codon:yes stop_codon:yes gene_type:complete
MTNKSKKILTEISPGELLDKISILEIKSEKIKDKNNLLEISKEYKILKNAEQTNIIKNTEIENLCKMLKEVNLNLWNTEDQIRICEKNKDFSKKFIDLARNVYLKNDTRAKIKSDINKILGSHIKEIKEYIKY